MQTELLPHPLYNTDPSYWANVTDQQLENQPDAWYKSASAFAELWSKSPSEAKRTQGIRLADACVRHFATQASLCA